MSEIQEHLQAICADAGLGVMVQVYEILHDREVLPTSTLLALSEQDVTEHYNCFIGPAIDRIEDSLTADTHDSEEASICRHCGHGITLMDGTWVAPDAGFDMSGDGIWRETCPDNHEDRIAAHEPEEKS